MIKKLHLKNYAKHKDLTIDFSNGLTTICGKNGAGKTLIVEAISFALFGIKELRGAKSDYSKDMSVELHIEIKGKPYKIVRSMTNCVVNDVIVGTTECNKFIASLLGFGSDVYNFAIYAKQAELTRLTDATPAERKECIDALIGAKKIDEVIKIVRSRVNEAKARVSAVAATLSSLPTLGSPVKPTGNRSELEAQLAAVRSFSSELARKQRVQAQLNTEFERVELLPAPAEPANLLSEADIAAERTRLNDVNARMERIRALNLALPAVTTSELPAEDELERQLELAQAANFVLPTCPRPTLTMMEIALEAAKNSRFSLWEQTPEITCPHCGGKFRNSDRPEPSIFSDEELQEQVERHNAWDSLPDDAETREKPCWSVAEICAFQAERKQRKLRDKILADIAAISHDGFDDYADAAARVEESAAYWSQLHAVEKVNGDKMILKMKLDGLSAEIAQLESELAQLPPAVDLESQVYAWTDYELKRNLFEQNEQIRSKILADKDAAEADVERLSRALDGMIEFKRRIKTFVIPSLQTVASQMISEMSDGELNRFEIDEDFDILLDGKKICLLSGSEKALANIALRLSLGRVLTKNVLSVFIGDELDASMSEERAEAVHTALLRLRRAEKVNQILVITHKELESDHAVRI